MELVAEERKGIGSQSLTTEVLGEPMWLAGNRQLRLNLLVRKTEMELSDASTRAVLGKLVVGDCREVTSDARPSLWDRWQTLHGAPSGYLRVYCLGRDSTHDQPAVCVPLRLGVVPAGK